MKYTISLGCQDCENKLNIIQMDENSPIIELSITTDWKPSFMQRLKITWKYLFGKEPLLLRDVVYTNITTLSSTVKEIEFKMRKNI